LPQFELSTQEQRVSKWDLRDSTHYQAWRHQKLISASGAVKSVPVALTSLAHPTDSQCEELRKRCASDNMVIYQAPTTHRTDLEICADLLSFAHHLGLQIAERHRSAGAHGVVALRVSDAQRQRGYIPYSRKPMNWHTDGYYNAPHQQIRAMVLHCVNPADDGGGNHLLDPDIAYIRLRDQNPAHITALIHPEAMTIPENSEPDGTVRPTSIGPVFSIDANGYLAMRYTARTRSIKWRDTADTTAAVAALSDILTALDPLLRTVRLGRSQGLLCNNVLHNRTGFDPDMTTKSNRLVYRLRFHNRLDTVEGKKWPN